MTAEEIINSLECCYGFHCERCPLKADIHCRQKLLDESIDLIKRQRLFLEGISQMIVDNTYPYFDKDGKPVNIWNPDGYRMIEQRLKEMAGGRDG